MTSLPVPVSPVIMTVVFVGATASTWLRIGRRLPRRPTIVSRKGDCPRSDLCTRGLSACRVAPAFIMLAWHAPASGVYSATEIMFPPIPPYLDSSFLLVPKLQLAQS